MTIQEFAPATYPPKYREPRRAVREAATGYRDKSAAGVAPRMARAALQQRSINLMMNVYTEPTVLDIGGALDALPSLPLGAKPSERQRNVPRGPTAVALYQMLHQNLSGLGSFCFADHAHAEPRVSRQVPLRPAESGAQGFKQSTVEGAAARTIKDL
jgi:hypothetical protein